MENNNKEQATNTHDNSTEAVNKSHLATLQPELSRQINTLTEEIKKITAYTSLVPKLVDKLENLEKKTWINKVEKINIAETEL